MKKLLILLAILIVYIACSPTYASYNTTNVVKDMGTNTPQDSEHPIALVQSIRMHSRVLNGLYHPKVFTSSGTATDIDTYLIGSSSTSILISLPLASTLADGTSTKGYIVKNIGAGTITLSPTVDGVGSPTVSQNHSMSLFTDGTRWLSIGGNKSFDSENLDGLDGSAYARSGANSDITSLSAVNTLTATTISNTNLSTTTGTVTTLGSTNITSTNANVTTGTVTNLVSTTGTVTTLASTTGNITNLVTTNGTITTLNNTTLNTTNISAVSGTLTNTLRTGSSTTILGDLTVSQSSTLNSGLTVTGNATFYDDLIMTGGALSGINYVKRWEIGSGSVIGTGNVNFVAGPGISITGTCTNGVGTVTFTGVGTNTAGGWLDTGTQTVSTALYPINLQGQLQVNPSYGVTGLTDGDIPNTITLDNITQITTRNFSDINGKLSFGTQTAGTLGLGTQTSGTLSIGTQTSGLLSFQTQVANYGKYTPDIQAGSSTVGTNSEYIDFNSSDFSLTQNGSQTAITLSAIQRGTTSVAADYLAKLGPNGKVNVNQLPKLGTYTAKAINTDYQAASDGYVVAKITSSINGCQSYIEGFTDSGSSPTTSIAIAMINYKTTAGDETIVQHNSITMPVRKDDYWRVDLTNLQVQVATTTVKWIPYN